uniref:DUF5123 domain-containing protein n=1 Tax=uncultured Bacteroides sp. TaxID=162156 RepID=UPI0025E47123|nr:DUF5123 domain-containing protein [uncultured Bacteroides sp.]
MNIIQQLMNMNIIKSTRYTVLSGLLIVLTVLATSCEKANDWETDSSYNRLFRTTKVAVSPSINNAEVIWNNTINTDYYIIEINTSELTAEEYQEGFIIYGEDKNIKSSPYTIDGLDANTSYYVRIRSCSETASPSKWVYPENTSFKTKTEQLINDISTITGSTAIVTWKKNQTVTHFLLTNTETSAVRNIPITAEMSAAGSYQLTELEASTSYTIGIYNTVGSNEVLRGEKSFQTTENFPAGYTPVYLNAADDPNEILAVQSGNIVLVVPHSTPISFSKTVIVPESITSIVFWGASGGAEQATMETKTILTLGSKDMVRFYNLNIDAQKEYFFNLQKSLDMTDDISTNINTLLIENCTINNVKSLVRAKEGVSIAINKVSISRCIINGCSGDMFAYKESTPAQIPVTEIINSTLIKPQARIFYAGNAASFSMESCTMYGWGGSKAILELGDKNTTGMSLAIKNTILANGGSGRKAHNANSAANLNLVIEKVYGTSDMTFHSSLGDVTKYDKSSTEVFENPEEGNFKIIDALFPSGVGDPRWIE